MKNKTTITLGLITGMGIASSLLSQSVLADQVAPTYDHPLQELQKNQQEQSPYSTSGNSSNFNVFSLIHQAQLGTGRDLGDFSQEQGKNIDSAAAKFRLQQMQLLRNQNQATPAVPISPSSAVGN